MTFGVLCVASYLMSMKKTGIDLDKLGWRPVGNPRRQMALSRDLKVRRHQNPVPSHAAEQESHEQIFVELCQ